MLNRKNGRPTIGYLVDWFEKDYQTYLRDGVIDAAEANDANLLCFVGGALRSSNEYETQRNVLYNLVSEHNVDGLIIMTASIGHWVTTEEIREFCLRFRNIPKVSIALPIKDTPTIMVNQEIGMRGMLDHLLDFHNYKKIAFIGGPETNPEVIQRYRIYRESLEAHKIALDPDLVVEGDFRSKSGITAIQTLLDKRKVLFDAVIALNDEMAIGAMSELQKRKIHVPSRIAIVGFDDDKVAKFYSPPITTVRQPLYEQGKKALETVLAVIRGEKVPEKIYLDSELKIRQSCGCMGKGIIQVRSNELANQIGDCKTLYERDEQKLIEQVRKAIAYFLPQHASFTSSELAEDYVHTFWQALVNKKGELFLHVFNAIVYRVMESTEDLNQWQYVLSSHRRWMLPCLTDPDIRHRAEELWHQARVIIAEFLYRRETLKRLNLELETQKLRDLQQELNLHIEVEELLKVIATDLPRIGIPSAFISLYNEVMIPGETSKLVLAYTENGKTEINRDGRIFRSEDLVPPDLFPSDRRFVFIVEAFFYGLNQLGFGIFEMGPKEGVTYELLRLRLSSSLRGALLLKQVKDQAHCLEEQVTERTRDLIRTNEALEQEIVERKRVEGMLIAYIASHDLQEPLRMIAGYVGLLERRYKDKLDQNANEFIEYVVDGAKRMQRMINDLLTFSRVNSKPCNIENIDSSLIVNQAVTNLKAVIEEKHAKIIYMNLPVISADFSQLTQVFQNLIGNAIKFQSEANPPIIEISALESDNEWKFGVKDNGIGIDPEYNDKIFLMFRRLHVREAYPGSGIGLTICKKIIERHDGHIWVESEVGHGATFFFTIPKRGE
jgi:DNA-binding LacI/PurR family transcriptional regulator/signal transduction histidine kinase